MSHGGRFGELLPGTLCACLAIALLAGCERADQPTGQDKGTAQTRPSDERLARIWTLLGEDDPNSFREALAELATLPPEVYHDPPYGVDGPPQWDTLRIGEASDRLDGKWMKATVRGFVALLEGSDPQQARRDYEAFDALLAGVMRAARRWTVRQPGGVPPLAYHSTLGLRTLLPQAMLESRKHAGDTEFEQLLKDRRERLYQTGGKSFSRISEEVP